MRYIIAFLVCCIPTMIEVMNDQRGESRKGNDILVLSGVSIILSIILQAVLKIPFYRTLPLIFGIHLLTFDYIINIILFKNKIIESTGARYWFVYLSKVSKFDRFWINWDPWIRLVLRIVIFMVAIIWFLG